MDEKLQQQIDEQEVKIDQILNSVRKTEKYMRLTFWVTMAVVVLPLLAGVIIAPYLVSQINQSLGGLVI